MKPMILIYALHNKAIAIAAININAINSIQESKTVEGVLYNRININADIRRQLKTYTALSGYYIPNSMVKQLINNEEDLNKII